MEPIAESTPFPRAFALTVSGGDVFTRLGTLDDPFDPPRLQVQTTYKPAPKGSTAKYGPSPMSMQRLPSGEHTFEIQSVPPLRSAVLALGLRSADEASVDAGADRAGEHRFVSGSADLTKGAVADLLLYTLRPGPALMTLRWSKTGAYDPLVAQYDDGSGFRDLVEPHYGFRVHPVLKLRFSLGDCSRIDVAWNWS